LPQDLAKELIRKSGAYADQPPDQILLISDGVELGGSDLAAAARELPAPVSSLMAGDPMAIKDLVLQRLWVPSYALANDRALVSAEVRSLGIDGEATVSLFQVIGGVEKAVANTTVKLKPDGEPSIARIEFQTPVAGLHRFILKITPKPGELTELNNSASFNLDVRPEKIKLLVMEGEPSWEYRYIKQAMESDPCVQFHGLVRLPEQEWFYQGPDKRPDGKAVISKPTQGFPDSSDELNYFDVVIFGDLDRKLFEQQGRFDMVDAFTRTHGGGVVTIGGLRVYNAGSYDQTPLARMLPFDLIPEKKTQLINRFNVEVTTQGMMHPVMQLEYDPAKNQEAWANLPWVEGGNAISAAKPGATLLMVHPTLKTKLGPRPVAAAWQYGRGRVISSVLDGTWHWRLARKTDQDYHQRFWGLVVRWLAGDPRVNKPYGDLVAEYPSMEAGAQASFFTMVRDPDGNPRTDAVADFTIDDPSGQKLVGRSASDPRLPGRYGFSFTPKVAGDYAVSVTITTAAGDTNTQKRVYYVGPSRAEYLRPVPDHDSLRSLAKATGGNTAPLADYASLQLPESPASVSTRTVVITLWHAPGLYAVLLLSLLLEWLMRKRRGLS
jgi:uncharacterized membrane protein